MILWFFIIVSWNGSIDTQHGFNSFETCDAKRAAVVLQMKKSIRGVTPCVGIPVSELPVAPSKRKEGV